MIAYRHTTPPPAAPVAWELPKAANPTPPAVNGRPWPKWYRPPTRGPFDLQALIAAAANDLGVHPNQVLSASRHRETVLARMVVAQVLRDRGWSFPRIATALNRDHSTIITNHEKVEVYSQAYPGFRLALEKNRNIYS